MKQIVQNYKTGELTIEELPAPGCMAGGLLIENRCSLISAGTEKTTVDMAKKSLVGKAKARPDLVKKVINQVKKDGVVDTAKMVMGRLDTRAALGYTSAGVVAEVGSNTQGFVVGDRVACAGQNYASHAEVVSVPKNLCVAIPDGVDFEDASYVAVGSIALQGVRQAEPRIGEVVAVIGLGLLGQLVVQILKANGCRVIASDLAHDKLELAKKLGADVVVDGAGLPDKALGLSSGHGVDSVIITASTKSSEPVAVAGDICRKKGKVVVVGAVGMEVPREPYYLKELDLRLSCSYGPGRYDPQFEEKGNDYPYGYVRWTEQRNMAAFLELVAQEKVNLKAITTHRFNVEKAEEAYHLITERVEPYLGIVLEYTSNSGEKFSKRKNMKPVAANSEVRFGIIGAGNHVKDMLLPCIQRIDSASIGAICTKTGISANTLAQKVGAGFCTSDSMEVMQDSDVNAVLIGTRHDSHSDLIIESLNNGKHVFVEKPLCLTIEQLEEIETAYSNARTGLIIQPGFNRRYSEHATRIKDFFASRTNPLTMIYRVNAGEIPGDHWIQDMDAGGGRIIGEACHFIDFMQFICGSLPVDVYARAVGSHTTGVLSDKLSLTLTFSDGSIGTLVYCADGDKGMDKERFEAFSDRSAVVLEDFHRTEFFSASGKSVFKTRTRDKGFDKEIKHFVSLITQGHDGEEMFAQAKATTLATIRAMQSMASRKCIAL